MGGLLFLAGGYSCSWMVTHDPGITLLPHHGRISGTQGQPGGRYSCPWVPLTLLQDGHQWTWGHSPSAPWQDQPGGGYSCPWVPPSYRVTNDPRVTLPPHHGRISGTQGQPGGGYSCPWVPLALLQDGHQWSWGHSPSAPWQDQRYPGQPGGGYSCPWVPLALL